MGEQKGGDLVENIKKALEDLDKVVKEKENNVDSITIRITIKSKPKKAK